MGLFWGHCCFHLEVERSCMCHLNVLSIDHLRLGGLVRSSFIWGGIRSSSVFVMILSLRMIRLNLEPWYCIFRTYSLWKYEAYIKLTPQRVIKATRRVFPSHPTSTSHFYLQLTSFYLATTLHIPPCNSPPPSSLSPPRSSSSSPRSTPSLVTPVRFPLRCSHRV